MFVETIRAQHILVFLVQLNIQFVLFEVQIFDLLIGLEEEYVTVTQAILELCVQHWQVMRAKLTRETMRCDVYLKQGDERAWKHDECIREAQECKPEVGWTRKNLMEKTLARWIYLVEVDAGMCQIYDYVENGRHHEQYEVLVVLETDALVQKQAVVIETRTAFLT